MNYVEILEDVMSVLTIDYSGIKEKRNMFNCAQEVINLKQLMRQETFTDFDFYLYVNRLLLRYSDKHLFFNLIDNNRISVLTCGFKLRYYNHMLVITEVFENNCELKNGMKIIKIDGINISEIEKEDFLIRHLDYWQYSVLSSKYLLVETDDGTLFEYITKIFPVQIGDKPFKFVKEDKIGYMKILDFFDPIKMEAYLNTYAFDLLSCSSLIIDVRDNPGGTDASFYNLLAYCFNDEIALSMIDTEEIEFNMTERNYQLRMPRLKKNLSNQEDHSLIDYYNKFVDFMDANRNKGFVKMDFYHSSSDRIIKGYAHITDVIILIDSDCLSSAESFVNIAKTSNKVKLLGRPTGGALDYCNLAEQKYNNRFSFKYPTSRSGNIDLGKSVNNVGIIPDIHVPWHPIMLEEDIDLAMAIDCLKPKGQFLQYSTDFLLENSKLPGPRSNLELLYGFIQNANMSDVLNCLKIHYLTPNTPEEFVLSCGVGASIYLAALNHTDITIDLKYYSNHESWRVREAICIGFQQSKQCIKPNEMLTYLEPLKNGTELEIRTYIATLSEPALLRDYIDANMLLDDLLTITVTHFNNQDKLNESQKVLKKALGYCWSVALCGEHADRTAFEKLLEYKESKHIRGIISENLKKSRLMKLDSEWAKDLMYVLEL